jgi:hypothetical protein
MHIYTHPERAVTVVWNEVTRTNILNARITAITTRYVIRTGKNTIFDERPLSHV